MKNRSRTLIGGKGHYDRKPMMPERHAIAGLQNQARNFNLSLPDDAPEWEVEGCPSPEEIQRMCEEFRKNDLERANQEYHKKSYPVLRDKVGGIKDDYDLFDSDYWNQY